MKKMGCWVATCSMCCQGENQLEIWVPEYKANKESVLKILKACRRRAENCDVQIHHIEVERKEE